MAAAASANNTRYLFDVFMIQGGGDDAAVDMMSVEGGEQQQQLDLVLDYDEDDIAHDDDDDDGRIAASYATRAHTTIIIKKRTCKVEVDEFPVFRFENCERGKYHIRAKQARERAKEKRNAYNAAKEHEMQCAEYEMERWQREQPPSKRQKDHDDDDEYEGVE